MRSEKAERKRKERKRNRHRHQRPVGASWLSVAQGEQLRMLGVHCACGLRMRGSSSYFAGYVYLQAPPTLGTPAGLRLSVSGAAPDAAINLA